MTLPATSAPGTLHLVSTPIGNLEDITLRALRVLREVALIAAEDTRRTGRLLAHYAIPTPTVSYHAHNVRTRLPQLVERLLGGQEVALVTDAGTPGISDPGTELVDSCIRHGIPINPVPGVSAPLTAAIASGFPLNPLTILGFPPHRAHDRKKWMSDAARIPNTFTFFESPHRISEALADAAAVFGERPIIVARELTKAHQQLIRGLASDAASLVTTRKGEFTVVVGPVPPADAGGPPASDREIAVMFGQMTSEQPSLTRRQAIAAVAQRARKSTREVYAALERDKSSIVSQTPE
jgi:16S rRNA (cytidine1402-2'-O)-methyltransferase